MYRNSAKTLEEVLDVVLADGPGEEVAAFTPRGDLWIPPMDVNRLGGTTLAYVERYLASKLGIRTFVRPFSLRNIMQREIETLIYLGNAARIAPIGEIKVFDSENNPLYLFRRKIGYAARKLVDGCEQEVSAQIEPAHPSLLTPVDLESGKKARGVLDGKYSGWF